MIFTGREAGPDVCSETHRAPEKKVIQIFIPFDSRNKLDEMERLLCLQFSLIFKIKWRLSLARRAHET